MNPAITAALIAGQQSEAADPVARLTKAGALDSSTAIAIENPTAAEAKLIDQAVARGLIRRHADGRLSVNARAVAERNTAMGHQFMIIMLIALSVLASAVALLAFSR